MCGLCGQSAPLYCICNFSTRPCRCMFTSTCSRPPANQYTTALLLLCCRHKILQVYFDQYILKAGTEHGGAGAAASQGVFAKIGAALRGRKSGPETIAVKDVQDSDLWWAAERMEGFSGAFFPRVLIVCIMQGRHAERADSDLWPQGRLCSCLHHPSLALSSYNHLQAASWPSSWRRCRPWRTAPTTPS